MTLRVYLSDKTETVLDTVTVFETVFSDRKVSLMTPLHYDALTLTTLLWLMRPLLLTTLFD